MTRGSVDDESGDPEIANRTRQLAAMPWRHSQPTGRDQLRRLINLINLSTVTGLLIAGVGGASLSRGPHGLVLANGYRLPFPQAGAFTVGDVVISCR